MDITVQFNFKGKVGQAIALIDYKAQPCFIFAIIKSEELVKKFGDYIAIKTDWERVLDVHPDNELDALRLAIFEAIKDTKEFAQIKGQYSTAKTWPEMPEAF